MKQSRTVLTDELDRVRRRERLSRIIVALAFVAAGFACEPSAARAALTALVSRAPQTATLQAR